MGNVLGIFWRLILKMRIQNYQKLDELWIFGDHLDQISLNLCGMWWGGAYSVGIIGKYSNFYYWTAVSLSTECSIEYCF